MSEASAICRKIETALQSSGILVRGTVDFSAGEGPFLASGERAGSVVLLGNGGGSIWPAFSLWKMSHAAADPLDTWSKEIIGALAKEIGATAYFPSDLPWQPFQQWAMRAEGLKPSPLGLLIHPKYGLWHGYRGAIGLPVTLDGKIIAERHPCETCLAKPCLSTCPADAITPTGFAVAHCRDHLATAAGQSGCMITGCLARHVCPIGAEYRYSAEQIRFHMQALR